MPIEQYNPMNDVLFKFIFGKDERKYITIDLISSMLDRSKDNEVVDITFQNIEMIPLEADKMGAVAIRDAFDAANNFMLSEEQRLAYINREMAIMDYNTNMRASREEGLEDGWKKGKEEGIKEGVEKGMEKGISQMVLELLKAKQPISLIAQVSKFSKEQISNIAKVNGITI